jgi:hypothetical protein
MEIMAGGDPLSEPLTLGVDRPKPEEIRFVAKLKDQAGIAMPQAAGWHLGQPVDVRPEKRISFSHHRGPHPARPGSARCRPPSGGLEKALDQISDLIEIATSARATAPANKKATLAGGFLVDSPAALGPRPGRLELRPVGLELRTGGLGLR